MSGGESSAAVHASPGVGGYAYSTTLRRQASLESSYPPQRPSSPHHASPYRKRTASSHYQNGRPPVDLDPDGEAQGLGILGKTIRRARRMMGRREYAELAQDEEDRKVSSERRARETPSSIYAHKTIDVSLSSVNTP